MTNKIIKIIIAVLLVTIALTAFATTSETEHVEPTEITTEVKVMNVLELPLKEYAQYLVAERFGEDEWKAYETLVQYEVCGKEKGTQKPRKCDWTKRNKAQNPNSTAFGIGQFLDSTWKIVDCKKTSNAHTQVRCMIDYIENGSGNFNTPSEATIWHQENNWY